MRSGQKLSIKLVTIACLVLAAILGPITIISNAQDLFDYDDIIRPILINMAVGGISALFGLFLLRSIERASILGAGVLVLWHSWFIAEMLGGLLSPTHALTFAAALWLGALASGAYAVAQMSLQAMSFVSSVAAVILLAALSIPVGRIAQTTLYLVQHKNAAIQAPLSLQSVSLKPDIYHILLDGYARADVLKGIFGVDNSRFLDELRERRFKIVRYATSNYNQTILSTGSLLGMNYVNSLLKQGEASPKLMRALVIQRIHHSSTVQTLSSAGYVLQSTLSFYSPLDRVWGDLKYSRPLCAVSFAEVGYFDKTPLHNWCKLNGWSRGSLFKIAFQDAMSRGPVDAGPPVFQFRHVLSPHPPFMLDAGGEIVEPSDEEEWSLRDGSHFTRNEARLQERYRLGYKTQLSGLNQHLLNLVANLLRDGRPKIIIIHGDHGSGLKLDQNMHERTCLWERFSPLLAVYASDGKLQNAIPDDISLVNLYRVVFRTYFGSEEPLLANRHYYFPFDELSSANLVQVTRPCN